MAQSIKLSDDIMDMVRQEADLQTRSVAGQVTHYIRVARAIEQSGMLDHLRISAALEGKLDTKDLMEHEEEAWLDAFAEKMGRPGKHEQAFHDRREALGRGVGLDADGQLVYARAAIDA